MENKPENSVVVTGGTIVLATQENESLIRACAEQAFQPYVRSIGQEPAPMKANFAQLIADRKVHVYLDDRRNLCGYIVCFKIADVMRLENVAVLPRFLGRGVGGQLIRFCEFRAKQLGMRAIELYTNEKMSDNLSLYPYLGYVEIARRAEDGFNRVYFQKILT